MKFDIDLQRDNTQSNLTASPKVNTRDLITINYDPYNLNVKVKPKVVPIECVRNSVNLSEIEFSNMIPCVDDKAVDPYIEIALERVQSNPDILLASSEPVRYSGQHRSRIKTVLSEYLSEDDFDSCCDYFRKSDVTTDIILKNRGAFRVVCVYLVEPMTHKKQKHSKHYLKPVLIDPYHLFIPSRHNGLTAEEYRSKTYLEVSDYSRHIGELFHSAEK